MSDGVVITGLGAVTSVGAGCDTLWHALDGGRRGVEVRSLPVDVGTRIDVPIARVSQDEDVPGLASELSFLVEQDCAGHRDLAYALVACREAMREAGLSRADDLDGVGMVQAFEAPGTEAVVARLFELVGGMSPNADTRGMTDRGPDQAINPIAADRPDRESRNVASPPGIYDLLAPSFYRTQPFLYVHLAAKALGLHGYCTSVHNACSSGAFAIEAAAMVIRSGASRAMIVCGGEAFDTAVRLEWFRRLGLYASDASMTPFVDPPTGFFVGEGGAAIVLESEASAKRRGATILARYRGGSFRHQGWKQVLPDVRGMWLREAMKDALRRADLAMDSIDLVVPHGAGTSLSDRYEATCLEQALGGSLSGAHAAAFKPNYGHMLAASGIVDTVAALLAMKHATVPPLSGASVAVTGFPSTFANVSTRRDIRTVLKLFTGFTGHDAALLFQAS